MPYPTANTLLDEAYPKGALNYWKSGFLGGLDEQAIDSIVEQFATTPSTMTAIGIEHFHGAVTRVGVSETAVPHREPGHNMFITPSRRPRPRRSRIPRPPRRTSRGPARRSRRSARISPTVGG